MIGPVEIGSRGTPKEDEPTILNASILLTVKNIEDYHKYSKQNACCANRAFFR